MFGLYLQRMQARDEDELEVRTITLNTTKKARRIGRPVHFQDRGGAVTVAIVSKPGTVVGVVSSTMTTPF